MKYQLYALNKLIGESLLEGGDPPMGVAFGELIPTEKYAEFQAVFEAQDFDAIESLELYITSGHGVKLVPNEGIGIEDYSRIIGEQSIQVNVFGIDSKIYKQFFPEHVVAYKKQFK